MTYPADVEGREAKRDELIRRPIEDARRREERLNPSGVRSDIYGKPQHEMVRAAIL
jgi:hypothetical protein